VPHRQNLPAIERSHLLAATLPHPYDVMALPTAYAGPRWGEVVALETGDVNTRDRTIHIRRTAVEAGGMSIQPPKNRRHRLTFYPDHLAASVERVCDEARIRAADGGSSRLFPSRQDRIMRRSNFHRRYWQAARNQAGWHQGWTFHTLRHCAAVWMLFDLDCDVHDVAEVLGHADPTVTQRIYVQAREGVASRLAQRAS
jgi:integrase